MNRPVVAVVLAGGTGTRLYPASRADRPKQFLPLAGEESLLARTVERCGFTDAVVVSTREAFADRVPEHAPDAEVLIEPAAKDTGPALAYATHEVRDRYDDPVVLAVPSDHVVGEGFATTAGRAAAVAAETGDLVTLGVEPDRPATGYGYVEPGQPRGDHHAVERFREKPDADEAEQLVEAGCYWNAGIFAWTSAAFLEVARTGPLEPIVEALDEGEPDRGFDAVEPVSVDRAVLEPAADRGEVAVVPADFDWDDLGAWDALRRVLDADADGNVATGEAVTLDASGNVLASDDVHVSVVGADDLVVAAYDDRVLVVPVEAAQRVREVVATLREDGSF